MVKDQSLEETLEELRKTGREVRLFVKGGFYYGKIHSIAKKYVHLFNYFVGEDINTPYGPINRIRVEKDITLPIKKKHIMTPMALKEGYLDEYVITSNQSSSERIKNNLERKKLFKDYVLPEEKIVSNESLFKDEIEDTKSQIGFNYSKRDIKSNQSTN